MFRVNALFSKFNLITLHVLVASPLVAQSTGRIGGTVTDPTGAVIPQAVVISTNAGTGAQRTVQTNQDGIFTLPDLPIGAYSVEISKQGFAGQKRGIKLRSESGRIFASD